VLPLRHLQELGGSEAENAAGVLTNVTAYEEAGGVHKSRALSRGLGRIGSQKPDFVLSQGRLT
jgi:hypothetical protein